MYVTRHMEAAVARFIARSEEHKNVLLVEGARQVGKTALVEHVIAGSCKHVAAANIEKDSLLRSLMDQCADFGTFTRLLRDRLDFDPAADMVLFLDEAQESLALGGFVRFMKEDWSRASVILSGSTLRRLFRPNTRYPVGRVSRLVLGPFSFSEYLVAMGKATLASEVRDPGMRFDVQQHKLLIELFDRYLQVGGLPSVVLAGDSNYREVRAQIMADYEQDFIRLFGEDLLPIVKSCFRSVANYVGSPSKNTSVVPNPGSAVNEKIGMVFSRLENWHLLLRSAQMGPGPEGSHHYLPKRYMFDTGCLRQLREAAVPSIALADSLPSAARTPLGGVIENQVAVEIARLGSPLHGWKKSSVGTEIDFVLSAGGQVTPIECKATLGVNLRHTKGLADYLRIYGLQSGVIVSLAPEMTMELPEGISIRNLPVYLVERLALQLGAWP
jgi:hypothetical protein